MEEVPSVWVFHIGSSGTAKSKLLSMIITKPMEDAIAYVRDIDKREEECRQRSQSDEGTQLSVRRKRNLLYTAPTTQGIRADLAEHGEEIPGLLVRDELNGWLRQMTDSGSICVGDTEFWLSSYDGAYSNDVFADDKKSREVKHGKLSVIGGIQPKVFVEQMESGNANGFNSRPLFVHLPRKRRNLLDQDEMSEQLTKSLGQVYLAALKTTNSFVLSGKAEETFHRLFDQLEDLSLQAGSDEVEAIWSKGPGQVLRVAAAIHFLRVATGQEVLKERGYLSQVTVVSERSLELAAKLVMSGKTRAVQLHERAANPMLAQAEKLLEKAKKLQGKAPGKGVPLSRLRTSFSSKDRPTADDLKQMSVILHSRGLVQLLDGGKSIRVVR